MEQTYCHKCGAAIKYVFMFRGNKYGSECIMKLPEEEKALMTNNIDPTAIMQGLIYGKYEAMDIGYIIDCLPEINQVISLTEVHSYKVLGFAKVKRRDRPQRKKEEFAMRVYSCFSGLPQHNHEKYVYIGEIIKMMGADKLKDKTQKQQSADKS